MLDQFLRTTKQVADQIQTAVAEKSPALAGELDLPVRQRMLELLARGFPTFLHGLGRATDLKSRTESPEPSPSIQLGPAVGTPSTKNDVFAEKFTRLFLDMGGIFPKLAQVLSMRPDIIHDEEVLVKLRAVMEECKQLPFDLANSFVKQESAPFASGSLELQNWPEFTRAGSIAQVAPFVYQGSAGEPGGNKCPDGIVKMTFDSSRETMAVDFRLLRSQLKMMETTGLITGITGLQALRPKQLTKIRAVWKLMVEMEAEIMAEFDLRHEFVQQLRGKEVIESMLSGSAASSSSKKSGKNWIETWRDGMLPAVFSPSGPATANKAMDVWHRAGEAAAKGETSINVGLMSRLATRVAGGKTCADAVEKGQIHMVKLRASLRRVQVVVPSVMPEASGKHVLAMSFAHGVSLKQLLDVISRSPESDAAQGAAAWFAVLLIFVIVPLWGKMLFVIGCCHADPHPGNFKVDGIQGMEQLISGKAVDANNPPGASPSSQEKTPSKETRTRRWFPFCGGKSSAAMGAELPITLSILDWGACVELDDNTRHSLCKLIVNLSNLRKAERESKEEDIATSTAAVASNVRALGVESTDDKFLAALGMALFDPNVAAKHPELRGSKEDVLGRNFSAGSGIGKILRVVAILVGICRELETHINLEAAKQADGNRLQSGSCESFVELFLVDLWKPFAEEGIA